MQTTAGPVTAEYEPTAGSPRRVVVSSEQLHGHACVQCGCTLDGLMDAGYVFTTAKDGGRLGWPVKACPQHAPSDGEAAA